MKAVFAASLIVLLAAVEVTAAADEAHRSHRFDTSEIEQLHIDYRAGELMLAHADGDEIEVELRIEPKNDRAEKAHLEEMNLASRHRGDRLTLSFEERNVTSVMIVRLPRLKRLTIDMGAGDLQGTLPPIAAEIRLGAGDVDLDLDRSATGRIDLKARVGDTSIRGVQNVETKRAWVVGSASSAVGEGAVPVEAKVRVGDVRVTLR